MCAPHTAPDTPHNTHHTRHTTTHRDTHTQQQQPIWFKGHTVLRSSSPQHLLALIPRAVDHHMQRAFKLSTLKSLSCVGPQASPLCLTTQRKQFPPHSICFRSGSRPLHRVPSNRGPRSGASAHGPRCSSSQRLSPSDRSGPRRPAHAVRGPAFNCVCRWVRG